MNEIIEKIASDLLGTFRYLKQIRTTGYLSKAQDGNYVYDEELKEIGLTDTMGNSGYIRYRSDNNLSIIKTERFGGVTNECTAPLRLVILVDWNNSPQALLSIANYLNRYFLNQYNSMQSVTCEYVGGGTNTKANHLAETGKEITNNNFKVIYADFNLKFRDSNFCEPNQSDMKPCNCGNVLDMGCYASCDNIELDLPTEEGTVVVSTDFNGSTVELRLEDQESAKVVIPSGSLNEDYTFILEIYQGTERITKEVDEVTYNCFQIKIKP